MVKFLILALAIYNSNLDAKKHEENHFCHRRPQQQHATNQTRQVFLHLQRQLTHQLHLNRIPIELIPKQNRLTLKETQQSHRTQGHRGKQVRNSLLGKQKIEGQIKGKNHRPADGKGGNVEGGKEKSEHELGLLLQRKSLRGRGRHQNSTGKAQRKKGKIGSSQVRVEENQKNITKSQTQVCRQLRQQRNSLTLNTNKGEGKVDSLLQRTVTVSLKVKILPLCP